ncbi:MAG: hypothetical protein K8I27_17310 [Planctomycetes bacterium]|nr:hypothetical protein [Planctomycetota bacterium]
MRWLSLLAFAFVPFLSAHPLDDQAQLLSEVVIIDDQRLELVLDFRYVSVMASFSEYSGTLDKPGLDGNGDGEVSHEELKRRFNLLVDDMAFSFGINVDGQPVQLQADFERFVFKNMESTAPVDFSTPYPIHSARIHYRFVFAWTAPTPLAPGDHRVEYFFSGYQTVVHTPGEQMIAFDARTTPRRRLSDTSYDVAMEVFPKLIFNWDVKGPESSVTDIVVQSTAQAAPAQAPSGPAGIGELPGWLTFVAGLCMALTGLGTGARRAFLPGKGGASGARALLTSMLLLVAGSAIALGALVLMGYIDAG